MPESEQNIVSDDVSTIMDNTPPQNTQINTEFFKKSEVKIEADNNISDNQNESTPSTDVEYTANKINNDVFYKLILEKVPDNEELFPKEEIENEIEKKEIELISLYSKLLDTYNEKALAILSEKDIYSKNMVQILEKLKDIKIKRKQFFQNNLNHYVNIDMSDNSDDILKYLKKEFPKWPGIKVVSAIEWFDTYWTYLEQYNIVYSDKIKYVDPKLYSGLIREDTLKDIKHKTDRTKIITDSIISEIGMIVTSPNKSYSNGINAMRALKD